MPWTLLLFPFGCTIGLQVGSIFEQGVASTLTRTTGAPKQAAIFFACFSVTCLALTFLYRVPRWYVMGTYSLNFLTSIASGTLMISFFYIGVVIAGGSNPIPVIILAATSIILAVEFEALVDRGVCKLRKYATSAQTIA